MAMTVTLTDAEAAAIPELIDLAERGREDFTHQATHGDYTPEDITAAETRHKAAQATANAIAAIARAANAPKIAHLIISLHSTGDDQGDDHYDPPQRH